MSYGNIFSNFTGASPVSIRVIWQYMYFLKLTVASPVSIHVIWQYFLKLYSSKSCLYTCHMAIHVFSQTYSSKSCLYTCHMAIFSQTLQEQVLSLYVSYGNIFSNFTLASPVSIHVIWKYFLKLYNSEPCLYTCHMAIFSQTDSSKSCLYTCHTAIFSQTLPFLIKMKSNDIFYFLSYLNSLSFLTNIGI